MSLSKKTRFEVFKRDSFKCSYCGRTPPQVVLEADHIMASSAGGSDAIDNLITACFDCNRGKGATSLEVVPPTVLDRMDVLREKELQLKEYNRFLERIQSRVTNDVARIEAIFHECFPSRTFTDDFRRVSVPTFLKKLPRAEVEEAMRIAIAKFPTNPSKTTSYFCGVCWKKIKGEER